MWTSKATKLLGGARACHHAMLQSCSVNLNRSYFDENCPLRANRSDSASCSLINYSILYRKYCYAELPLEQRRGSNGDACLKNTINFGNDRVWKRDYGKQNEMSN